MGNDKSSNFSIIGHNLFFTLRVTVRKRIKRSVAGEINLKRTAADQFHNLSESEYATLVKFIRDDIASRPVLTADERESIHDLLIDITAASGCEPVPESESEDSNSSEDSQIEQAGQDQAEMAPPAMAPPSPAGSSASSEAETPVKVIPFKDLVNSARLSQFADHVAKVLTNLLPAVSSRPGKHSYACQLARILDLAAIIRERYHLQDGSKRLRRN